MKNDTSSHWLTEEATAQNTEEVKLRFANNPLKSPNTQLIAAALRSGFKLMEPEGYRDTVEQTASGSVRRVEWFTHGSSRGYFSTQEFGEERLEFPEFRRR